MTFKLTNEPAHYDSTPSATTESGKTMAVPDIVPEDVYLFLKGSSNAEEIGKGGQKTVFRANYLGQTVAVKFLQPNPQPFTYSAMGNGAGSQANVSTPTLDDVTARAKREIETLAACKSQYLVKNGPIGLELVTIRGTKLLAYTEELIHGRDLSQIMRTGGRLAETDLKRLALHVGDAIKELWSIRKIHRDVKPNNIMLEDGTFRFVLLDLGLILDLDDRSYSVTPVGTPIYFSPEQFDFLNRRSIMDFRSDLFSLGVVLYEMATGRHPFITQDCHVSSDVYNNILNHNPAPPSQIESSLSPNFDALIMRCLGKRPAFRFRTPELFLNAASAL